MEQGFKIKAYSFGELARLYFPHIAKNSASWQLTCWINGSNALKEALEKTGKKPKQRILSPIQVRLIVDAFGEP